ncbi:p-hydroxycinnamoyl CoA hydratase/lyase [Nocardia sp. CA2R105]|uniref:p-hydroxycinnamoyl CoA hydratase/lyase n=1 Tax=Nocardia coffeae TaxID=2873381 RepID=UPI001CA6C10B|nr:p-hydroxycinnamoyl CoA hydratase/lyase [Nocardia coffeae]MBY8859430.1 p-hydroxycinnamoyl CoA hydratase/lyase [Nocardia coffeae]
MTTATEPWGETVSVEFEEGIAWVTLNRPDKRNAMNPALNTEMCRVLDHLEADPRCRVLVLTGAGESFSAGMDLKEYFRDVEATGDLALQYRVRRESNEWQWKRLAYFAKPTIAMVNGWCFGGAFTPLVACDLAIADETAKFGLSEVNWGIPPGSVVTKALAATVPQRDALYFIMTGETFDGARAAQMRLVNEAVPAERLRERTRELAARLAGLNPVVLHAAKVGYRFAAEMSWSQAEDYLYAKLDQTRALDADHGREKGLSQFLDDKSYRPGLGAFDPAGQ